MAKSRLYVYVSRVPLSIDTSGVVEIITDDPKISRDGTGGVNLNGRGKLPDLNGDEFQLGFNATIVGSKDLDPTAKQALLRKHQGVSVVKNSNGAIVSTPPAGKNPTPDQMTNDKAPGGAKQTGGIDMDALAAAVTKAASAAALSVLADFTQPQ